jgi:hypothetical protein
VIVPDEPVDLPVNQPLVIRVESGVYFTQQSPESGPMTGEKLARSLTIGMWADRDDIKDSSEFARTLRHQAERRGSDE